MSEYDHEPIRGLPGDLPAGESILWQGSPDWRTFARSALHTRWVSSYFAALAVLGLATGKLFGAGAAVVGGAITQGLLAVFAIAVARTTVYTITNRRVVLRIGVALNKCVNLPLATIGSADLRPQGGGHGDIALTLVGRHRLGFAMLWPHARPWRFGQLSPMLRAMPDAVAVAKVLARACAAVVPNEAAAVRAKATPVRGHGLQGAAA